VKILPNDYREALFFKTQNPPPLEAIEAAKAAGASEAVVLILETRAKRLGSLRRKRNDRED
jgi:hypothetical protein